MYKRTALLTGIHSTFHFAVVSKSRLLLNNPTKMPKDSLPLNFLLSMTSSLFALKSTTGAVNSSTVLFTTVHTNFRHNIMHEKMWKINGQ